MAIKPKLLIEGDRPLVILPELAKVVGLEEAVILQQLHFLLRDERNGKKLKDGRRWIYNTYEQWQEDHFPWMTVITLRRKLCAMEKDELILSCQPEGGLSRRKYYRLNTTELCQIQT